MRTGIIMLMCALAVAACGNADKPPPNDPTTASGYTSTTTSTSGAPTTTTQASAPDPAHPQGAHVSAGGPDTSGTYRDPNVASQRANGANAATPSPNVVGGTGTVAPNGTSLGSTTPVIQNPGSADQTKDADNTKINDRDRHGALTAGDQGNTPSEVKISAAVRRALVADKNLSFSAKNVKVITVGSKVTLRGPVKSEQERSAIESAAKQTEGVTEVDNQLEIKK